MTLRKMEIFIRAALDCACLLFVNYSVLCLCSRTHLSSFCTSSGAVHQAVWRMQFKCKFPAMDKDLLKARGNIDSQSESLLELRNTAGSGST